MEEYLDRAEKLKNHIAASDEKRQKQAVATNGKPAGGGGGSGQAKLVPLCSTPYAPLTLHVSQEGR